MTENVILGGQNWHIVFCGRDEFAGRGKRQCVNTFWLNKIKKCGV